MLKLFLLLSLFIFLWLSSCQQKQDDKSVQQVVWINKNTDSKVIFQGDKIKIDMWGTDLLGNDSLIHINANIIDKLEKDKNVTLIIEDTKGLINLIRYHIWNKDSIYMEIDPMLSTSGFKNKNELVNSYKNAKVPLIIDKSKRGDLNSDELFVKK